FQLRGAAGDRRELLARALDDPGVRDGVIQGDAVRIVVAAAAPAASASASATTGAATGAAQGTESETATESATSTATGAATSTATGADPEALRRLEHLAESVGGALTPVEPRFEDAFIDLLGGGPGGRSPLADRVEQVSLDRDIAVSCRDLTKRFGRFTAADSVTFDVRKGEIFGLLGPNGAGKSTTFKMLCGLLKPTAGTAEVVGHDLAHAGAAAKRRVGYMA